MKARRIKRLRKVVAKADYYRRRYIKLLDALSAWSHFYDFKCDPFFVGREKAEYNKRLFNRNVPRLRRKAEWYKAKTRDFTSNLTYPI
jgi:hypothetical protein